MTELDLSEVSEEVKKLNPEVFQETGKKPRKYRNIPVSTEGMSFDSGKEATDAQNFMLAVRAGQYIAYLHHVRFPLAGGIYFEADHVLINNDMTVSVFDSKGGRATITKDYKLKKRLFLEKYGKEIQEI